MSNSLFRKTSLDRISSPEQLNDYIRVSTPGVWMLLLAIVVLLVGVCVWGVLGHMDTVLSAAASASDGNVVAYVREEDSSSVKEGMRVTIGENEGKVLSLGAQPVRVDETFSDYICHTGSLEEGEWVYEVILDIACPDGVHSANIVIDSVSPMFFVLN